MRELIRHILKESRLQQGLKQVIENGNIFDAADMVGGIPTLKKIFKDDPEMSSLFDKLTGTIIFDYYVDKEQNIEFPLDYEIIGRHSNIHKTNHWPEINVFYDENKLTPEENANFKSIIKYLYDDAQHSSFKSKFDDGRIFNANYFTVKELNGENIDLFGGWDFSNREVENIHDKLYDGDQSLNESEEKQPKYLSIIKDLVEPYKNEVGVCDIKVTYDFGDQQFLDEGTYIIELKFGMKEVRKTTGTILGNSYINDMRLEVIQTIRDFLPIKNFFVGTSLISECGTKRLRDKSLNEDSTKEKSLVKLIEKDGLYNFIEMTGLDFNKIKSLLKHINNPKEVLKQYIRGFTIEKGGSTGENYGSLFAVQIPLSDTKYVEDILVHDEDSIAVEIWEYHLDEYGHREQKDQYLTTINNLTNEELLSIVAWMMETIKGDYWDR
jgi:hypothetical protein